MARRIAILKPDHLGDVILSLPAARRVLACHPERDVDYLCAPASADLVRWLLPEVRPIPIVFPHLDKSGDSVANSIPAVPADYEYVFGLRVDELLNDAFLRDRKIDGGFIASTADEHETWSQKLFVEAHCGEYSRTELFFESRKIEFPRRIAAVGLCISAGFVNNRWDIRSWFLLGRDLLANGHEVKIISGPRERRDSRLLSRLLRLAESDVIEGGADFGEFVHRVEQEVDVVVATDSGTAHLCSLVRPILSIFGPSPHRRYAPFGRHNRLIRLDVCCSPCCQYHRSMVNGCVTRECLVSVEAREVLSFLLDEPGSPRPCVRNDPPYFKFTGTSHLSSIAV